MSSSWFEQLESQLEQQLEAFLGSHPGQQELLELEELLERQRRLRRRRLQIQAQAEQNELPQPPAIGDMPDDLKKRMEDIEVIKNGDNIQVGDLGFRVWGFKGYRGDREKGRHSGWWFV